MLEKGTLHFHDFDRSKTYPLQSLRIKKGFKDVSGHKKRGIPVNGPKIYEIFLLILYNLEKNLLIF